MAVSRLRFSVFLVLFATTAAIQAADPVPVEAASSPTPVAPATLVPLPNQSEINSAQEATEGSVLPGEPLLVPEETIPSQDSASEMNVQPLPEDRNINTGPSIAELTRLQTKFRQAKTRAMLQPEIAELKASAFAAAIEREKRELLRQYYQAMRAVILKNSPELATNADFWTEFRMLELSRPRTEPGTDASQSAVEIVARRKKLAEQMKEAARHQ